MPPHFAPDDFDILIDGGDDARAASLSEHARQCEPCAAELDWAARVATALDRLPHVDPPAGFADRVMSRVQVFEPWHVALADSLRRMISVPAPVRVAAAAGLGAMAVTITALVVWASFHIEELVYAVSLAATRIEIALLTTGGSLIADVFGEAALAALRQGAVAPVATGLGLFLLALSGVTLGLRGLLAVARRRGN